MKKIIIPFFVFILFFSFVSAQLDIAAKHPDETEFKELEVEEVEVEEEPEPLSEEEVEALEEEFEELMEETPEPVLIAEPEPEEAEGMSTESIVLIVLAVLIVAGIIWYLLYKKK